MAGRLVAGLREACDEKEQELSELLTKLEALEIARAQRQKELGNLRSKWDEGALYNNEYEVTNVVDVHGDLSVSGNYNREKSEGYKPKPKPPAERTKVSAPTSGDGGRFDAGKEEEYAGEFAIPEWAKNEAKKMIKKETIASKDTKDVRIDAKKNELSSTGATAAGAIKRDTVVDGEETKGKVSGTMAMFSQMEKEESRDDMKERLRLKREERKRKEEEDKANAEERKRQEREDAERAEAEAAERKQLEEEAAKKLAAKQVKVGRLPGVPDEEPTDPAQLIGYLNTKKSALDSEILRVRKLIANFV